MKGLKGKNILVTGGGSGIGRAIVIKFAEEEANVAINYFRSHSDAEETEEMIQNCRRKVRDCGVKDLLVQADVSKESDVLRMFETVNENFGGMDILVNNAGIQVFGESHKLRTEDFNRVIDINLKGAYLCAREAIKHFLETGKNGVIINISSVHEVIPRPRYIGYSVSKGGMGNLTKTLALEYADRGIRVNAVAPGATITPINRAWIDDPGKKKIVESHIPLGRAATPEEIAGVVTFLASDEAVYITGQTLFVDGGLTLYPDFRTAWSGDG